MKTKAKPAPKFSWDQIDALRQDAGLAEDHVPAEAFTAEQYASQYSVARKTANDQLESLVKAGKLGTGKKLALSPSGRRALTRFYWP
jgi:Fic family protein